MVDVNTVSIVYGTRIFLSASVQWGCRLTIEMNGTS